MNERPRDEASHDIILKIAVAYLNPLDRDLTLQPKESVVPQ